MLWYRFPTLSICLLAVVGCDGGASSCGDDEKQIGVKCVKEYKALKTHLNGLGYLPEQVKRATLAGDSGGSFRVRRESDNKVAFEGTATDLGYSSETQENVSVADFSELTTPGEYVLEGDAGLSPPFRIGADIYADVVRVLMLGLYGQRCGEAVELEHQSERFKHGECHLDDAWLGEYGSTGEKQVTTLGWHDAGDYGKYTNNGSFSLGMLLLAWEQFQPKLEKLTLAIPEHGGSLPDFLAECRFQLDWLLSMQLEDGSVADRVTTQGFDGPTSPEASTGRRNLAPPSSVATADFVGVVSRAARAFEPFAPELAEKCRDAARRGWNFLSENPEDIVPEPSVRSRFTGGYWGAGSKDDLDDRLWAAAEYWETTGDEAALADFEKRAASADVQPYWDWSNLGNLGVFTYLLSRREGRDEGSVTALTEALGESVATIQSSAEQHPYGRASQGQYWWGINGVVARTAMNVHVYEQLVPDPVHANIVSLQLDHLLGRNYYGRSYVTGIGYNPPLNPHHRPSQADGSREPWPGLLVGGPWSNAGVPALAWKDDSEDYNTNEIAINWNAAMIYAAASLMPND